MTYRPATFILIESIASHSELTSRFERTLNVASRDSFHHLPHPEIPLHPGGTSAQCIIYALGHSEQLAPLSQVTPEILRQLRADLHHARSTKSAIHLFGLIDNQSPYGSRRALEAVLRILTPAGVKIVVHAGVWHPTPSEFRRGVREIESLCHNNVEFGSVFPVESALHHASAQRFIDGILHPHPDLKRSQLSLPLENPHIMTDIEAAEDDRFIFVNHALHGLDTLELLLDDFAPGRVTHLSHAHPIDHTIVSSLDKSKHIMAVANAPTHVEAYFGTLPHHPYFESYINHSASEALEMLISPHFGYHQKPFRTIVSLKEERRSDFDWLLSTYLKSIQSSPYYLCFLRPNAVTGSVLFTNLPLTGDQSLYRQLHHYV